MTWVRTGSTASQCTTGLRPRYVQNQVYALPGPYANLYKALTKKYNNERGEFTAMYKYANSHNVYNYATQSAPFIYVGDGSVKEYGKFKLKIHLVSAHRQRDDLS